MVHTVNDSLTHKSRNFFQSGVFIGLPYSTVQSFRNGKERPFESIEDPDGLPARPARRLDISGVTICKPMSYDIGGVR